jgi:hypothetical protein
LAEEACQAELLSILRFYAEVYFCEIAAFSIMGNHYHLVIRMEEERPLSDEEKRYRAEKLRPGVYPAPVGFADEAPGESEAYAPPRVAPVSPLKRKKTWPPGKWSRLDKRLFDISEFMRNVQMAFGRWYNDTHDRVGRFWAERFKSTVLASKRAVMECMLYVDLNPVRAGIVQRPEEHAGTSAYYRDMFQDRWLMPLKTLFGWGDPAAVLAAYRKQLYHRGAVGTKENHAAIHPAVVASEEERGFVPRGLYRKRLRCWREGVLVGAEETVGRTLKALQKKGARGGRTAAKPQLDGSQFSL